MESHESRYRRKGVYMHERLEGWLKDRADLFFKNTIKEFICCFTHFKKLKKQHASGPIHYPELEKWVGTEANKGTLWILKDNCHSLWKDLNPEEHPQAFLFDWMAGAIFHEAMKLKENVYLVEKYRPSFERALGTQNGKSYMARCKKFFQTTVKDIAKGIERLECLFTQASEHLRVLIVRERENAILLRFLLEQREQVDNVWEGTGGVQGILSDMFPEGLDQAYCTIGESYLEGSWYAEARQAFEKALDINPCCIEARSGLRLLEKRINEVVSTLAKEYEGYTAYCSRDSVLRQQIMGEA